LQKYELTDGGILFYHGSSFYSVISYQYFYEILGYSSWKQKPEVFCHMQPRLTAAYGEDGKNYCYSGTQNMALPWTFTLLEIKKKVETVLGRYNFCLLNRYRSGADSISLHSDNEQSLGSIIATISLGATKKFIIKHNATKETKEFLVSNGTLIIMTGTMQRFWKHEILKTKEIIGERIILTFRQLEV